MDNSKDEYGIGKSIDDDYIDVKKNRAKISIRRADNGSPEDDTDLSRTERDVSEGEDHSGETDVSNRQHDFTHIFDTGSGTGASSKISEIIDQNAIIEHDGRASTRTFFRPGEAPAHRQQRFRKLIQWQEDKWSGMKSAQREADRQRTIEGFCSKLDMSPYHTERVKSVIDTINLKHMAYFSGPKTILGVISLVANADGRFIRDEDDYKELMHGVGMDMSELKTVRGMIRDRVDTI